MDDPLFCQICKGKLQSGEPVVPYDDGFAHRFSTYCNWYMQKIAEYDANILKAYGVSPT